MRKSFALLAVLLCVSVAGCGGPDGSTDDPPATSPGTASPEGGSFATSDSLDGRTFVATTGRGVEITEDDALTISFEGDSMSVDAGCNSIGGNYSLDDGEIQAFLSSTLIGCPPKQAELEVFVSELLRQEAVTTLDGDELTLAGKNGTSLSLTD